MNITVRGDSGSASAGSSVVVDESAIVIRIGRPGGTGESADCTSRADRSALLGFAARADCYQGLVLWHRYEAVYALLLAKQAESDGSAGGVESGADVYTRLYDPLCQVAASYATAAGVRQCTAEHFVEAAVACMERIPAVGRLMRDGLICPAWFRRVVEQTALVDDADLLAFIDAEIAHTLAEAGALSAARVESLVSSIVAEHDPDAVTLTREQVKLAKQVRVNPLGEGVSEVIVTASTEDAMVVKDVLDAVIAGVCSHDPRTRGERRSAAAVARLAGTDFVCECGRDDCTAELSTEAIASRCARVVLHVVVRKETLGGESDTPAHLDGYGPISAEHVRELAARPDAVRREVDLGELVDHQAQRGNAYRPTAAVDAAVRGLFGTCSWPGCERAAWKSDLDHVCEFNHTDPSAGGPTCVCNLNPKCRFHHGLKTFVGGWVDDQVVDANGVIWTEVTTPEGFTVRQRALNMRLLPELGHLTCRHPAPTRPGSGHAGVAPERPRTRVEAKHQYRMRRRAANRRAREVVEAVVPTGASVTECGTVWGTEWGEPQF